MGEGREEVRVSVEISSPRRIGMERDRKRKLSLAKICKQKWFMRMGEKCGKAWEALVGKSGQVRLAPGNSYSNVTFAIFF